MGVVSIREEYLKEIADAIREKTGTSMPITTDTMGAAIMSLETIESEADLSNYYTKLETELILEDYATKEYVDAHSGGGGGGGVNPDLSDYATIEYVDEAIENIELTPGPTGPAGPAGNPGPSGVYIGTDTPTDSTVNVWIDIDGRPSEGSDVDLSNYYTKSEIDNFGYLNEGQVKALIYQALEEIENGTY